MLHMGTQVSLYKHRRLQRLLYHYVQNLSSNYKKNFKKKKLPINSRIIAGKLEKKLNFFQKKY